MATVVVAQRMWQRRDSAANWTSKNPVLAAGEIGVELGAEPTDTKFKIGDGSTPWTTLPYFAGDVAVSMRVSGGFVQYSDDGGDTWQNLIAIADLAGAPGEPGPSTLPMVNGDAPPQLMYFDDGSLLYAEV